MKLETNPGAEIYLAPTNFPGAWPGPSLRKGPGAVIHRIPIQRVRQPYMTDDVEKSGFSNIPECFIPYELAKCSPGTSIFS